LNGKASPSVSPAKASESAGPSVSHAVIAVDLGNSAAKWTVDQLPEQRVSLRSAHWSDCLIHEATAACNGKPQLWRVASVNRPITKLLIGRLQDERPDADVQSISCNDIPMVAKVANPDRVGIDRLLAAWMASQLFPGQPAIVVDAGSAITVDMISRDAEFLGGVILPGIALQFDSLARGTDALPAIELPPASEITPELLPIPAVDTVSAIRSGILLGAASAIDGLIDHRLERSNERQTVVIFTGGDGPLLSRLSRHRLHCLPRLVLDAIRSLPTTAGR
jgi:type III pantothenate kinase